MKRLPILVAVLRDPGPLPGLRLADWDLLLRQSTSANLSPTLLALIEEHGLLDAVPAQPRAHLEWVRALATRHRQAVGFEVESIQAALARVDGVAPLLLLKGAAYAMAGLRAGAGRLFGDIDIMVPQARLDDVESALMLHGWASSQADAYDQRYYRQWMHELPPMQHVRRQSSIDVHHAILPQTAPVHPDPALLRAAAVPIAHAPGLATLAPADMVLHSAVHLFFDGEFDKGLRDLLDLHFLFREFGVRAGFWEALPARARALELERPLFYALRYSRRLLGTPVPDAVVDALAPAAPNRALLAVMDALFERALLPMHASCADALTSTARFALYVRGNWLRMPPLMLARHLFHKAFLSKKQSS
ncbi:nucleotidyltransferase domain-containing protein [Massilia phyllosphaerae]|uniref:nucleotidyltransferase domain-containing protein n=1 Tax=Massilia phyllosphaerae TaxID=3106034 RepID=UPI002B1CCA13|nr:nucleotidyltransferase family protein [Massilia sp. SGZ-792]